MSIQGMRRRFAVHLRYVLYVLIGVFVLTLPAIFSPGLGRRRETEEAGGGSAVVARVNGQPVPRARVDKRFDQTVGQMVAFYSAIGQGLSLDQIGQLRLQAFDQAVVDEVLLQKAKQEGISASRGEIGKRAEKLAEQQVEQLKQSYQGDQLEQVLGQIVAQAQNRQPRSTSEAAFRKWMVKRLRKDSWEDLRDEVTADKLLQKVAATVSVGEADLLASYDQITTRQLLVSLHPKDAPARTDEQARKRAEDLRAKALAGAAFDSLAHAESDDPAAKTDGGLQPAMPLSSFPPDWQRAVASLKQGEISPPIKTPSGYVLVRVEKRDRQLPQDFDKNKQQLMANFVQQRRTAAWQEYTSNLRGQAKVDVLDPEILGYQALQQGKEKEALEQFRKAAADTGRMRGLASASLQYELASLLASRNQWKEAADSYSAAVDALPEEDLPLARDARAQVLTALGNASEKLGKPEDALLWYQEASNWSSNPLVHQQLMAIYNRANRPDLVEHETQWLKDYQETERAQQEALQGEAARSAQGQRPPVPPAPAPPTRKP
jgi:parvulin-like peptidyl-prolyl isomerase